MGSLGYKSLITTDATVTVLYQIANVALNTAFRVSGQIVGRKSDFTASYTCSFEAMVRRAASGSLVLVGSAVNNPLEDSAGAPAVTITVSSPHLNINVAGIAAETWSWKLSDIEIIYI